MQATVASVHGAVHHAHVHLDSPKSTQSVSSSDAGLLPCRQHRQRLPQRRGSLLKELTAWPTFRLNMLQRQHQPRRGRGALRLLLPRSDTSTRMAHCLPACTQLFLLLPAAAILVLSQRNPGIQLVEVYRLPPVCRHWQLLLHCSKGCLCYAGPGGTQCRAGQQLRAAQGAPRGGVPNTGQASAQDIDATSRQTGPKAMALCQHCGNCAVHCAVCEL